MQRTYNLQWLTDKFDVGEQLKYLFFWGHTKKTNEAIGSFCFSQWFELPFILDDITYQTAEHWMMANKALLFNDLKTYDKIINSKTPGEAKKLGRQVLGFDEIIWNDKRMDIVINGNIHKFNQHADYATYLLNTNDRILVEASSVDKIWGIGLAKDAEHIDNPYFWNGQNLLGFALMEVRSFLKHYGHFDYVKSAVEIPFKVFPKISRSDMFWRVGAGDTMLDEFFKYFRSLSEKERSDLMLSCPPPYDWPDFYE